MPDNVVLHSLMGKSGEVVTTLRPVGNCKFDGKKYECVAESGFVKKGAKVEVIEIESSQVTVREIEINQ